MAKTRRSNRKCWNRKLKGGNGNTTLKKVTPIRVRTSPTLSPVSASFSEENITPPMSATIFTGRPPPPPSGSLVRITNYKGAVPEKITIVSAPRLVSPTFLEGKTRKNRKNRKSRKN